MTTHDPQLSRRPRPGLLVGLCVVAAYAVVAIGLEIASGIDYDTWFDSAENVARAMLPAFGAGAVLLLGAAWWLRWDHVWVDEQRQRMGVVLWIPVVVTLLSIALTVVGADWSGTSRSLLATAALATLLVGLCEELLFRGILLRGARARLPEFVAALATSAIFGAFHLVNLALGAPAAQTGAQVLSAAFGGFTFYLVRRATRHLWVPILVHATYDFSLVPDVRGDGAASQLAQLLTLPTWLLCLVAMVVLAVRSSKEDPTPVSASHE